MRTTSGGRYLFTTSDENSGNVKKGPWLGMSLVKTVSCPLKSVTPQENDLEGLVRVIVPRIIIIITRGLL